MQVRSDVNWKRMAVFCQGLKHRDGPKERLRLRVRLMYQWPFASGRHDEAAIETSVATRDLLIEVGCGFVTADVCLSPPHSPIGGRQAFQYVVAQQPVLHRHPDAVDHREM